MIRRTLQIGFIVVIAFVWGCGGRNNSGLNVTANPNSPILITASSTVNGESCTDCPVAPYFTMNSVTLSWSGTNTFQLLSLDFYSGNVSSGSTTATSFSCGGSGSSIAAIFQNSTFTDSPTGCSGIAGNNAIDVNGNLTIQFTNTTPVKGCTVTTTSSEFYCDSLPITVNPNPFASYNVPVQVVVFGEGLDTNGNATGRINAVTNITLQ